MLYWVSDPRSRHSEQLRVQPQVALTVYAHEDTAADIHGVQLHGRATIVPAGPVWDHAWDRYTRKYPVVMTMPQIRERVADGRQAFYRLETTWLRWIDNRRGFGWKAELEL